MTFSFIKSKTLLLSLVAGSMLTVPAAFSQTLSIVSGQGQVVGPSQQTANLTVKLVDASGNPIAGAPITFFPNDPNGGYVPTFSQSVLTANDGTASGVFVGSALVQGNPPAFSQGTVIATYGTSSQVFYVTTTNLNATGGAFVSVNFSQIGFGQSFTGAAGSVAATPLQVLIQSQSNFGVLSSTVPNVSLQLVLDPTSTGTISCKEGAVVLSDASGIATCTPIFGSVGSGYFNIVVGGFRSFVQPIPFTVTVGPPALITINSGNNQSGNAGASLPLPIVATVTDLGGNPTPGIAMNFTSVTPNGATFSNVRQVTDSQGKVSASVKLGTVPGVIQISVADAAGLLKNPAIFTETVNLTITGLTKSSGDQQSAFVGTPFPSPLVVNLTTANNQPATGIPINFSVTSGSATVNTPIATVNGNSAQTTVTAGNTPGPVVITATSGQFSVTFNLNIIPPGPTNLSFTNGASGATNSMSPGSVVTIYGNGLANNIQGVTSAFEIGPLPISMNGVTAQIGGQFYAPIFDLGNVSGVQFMTIQVPWEVPPGPSTITIGLAGGGTSTVPIVIGQASPGLFTYTAADNKQYLVAIKANGTVAGPTNPATRGESLTIYLTGLPLTPGISTNSFAPTGVTTTSLYPLILGVANQGATFTSVAYAQTLSGVETITFIVPTSATPGASTVSIGVQAPTGTVYSQAATLNIQ